MWIDWDAYRLMEAKLAVESLDIDSIVFLPSSFITVSVFCMIRTIRNFSAHHDCIYIFFFQHRNQFSVCNTMLWKSTVFWTFVMDEIQDKTALCIE
jgi:hypothetical protein